MLSDKINCETSFNEPFDGRTSPNKTDFSIQMKYRRQKKNTRDREQEREGKRSAESVMLWPKPINVPNDNYSE